MRIVRARPFAFVAGGLSMLGGAFAFLFGPIAGTLVDKVRTGARDINKHYGVSGPNYLRS